MKVIWQSELDPYASKVLAKHWPDVPNLGDITTIDWSGVERPDLVCGGYPCQPFSSHGKRAGEDDVRYLWPWLRDSIRHLRPRWVLLENVAGHLSLGFDRVLADLASLGLDAEWSLVSACSMGAPHRRERLFVVANTDGFRREWFRPEAALQGRDSAIRPEGRYPASAWLEIPAPELRGVANGIPHRVDRNRTLGNAVVPQVAEYVGRLILEYEKENDA